MNVVKSRIILKVKSDTATLNIKHPSMQQKVDDIRKRVAAINAVLDVQVDSAGTSVILIVPLA